MTTRNALRWRLLDGVLVVTIGMGVLNLIHRIVTGGDVAGVAFNLVAFFLTAYVVRGFR